MNQIIITIDSKVSPNYAFDFLKKINFIKSIRIKNAERKAKKDTVIDEISLLSEKSLAEDWLSEDDNRWDKVL